MSTSTSMPPLPRQIDPRKCAQQGVTLNGFVPIDAMPRLQASLASDEGYVRADLAFDLDEQIGCCVNISLEASVLLPCQRCLEPLMQPLSSELRLSVLWREEAINHLPKSLEPWVVGEGPADIYQIIEDELILSLPIVVYHDELCVPTLSFGNDVAVQSDAEQSNPFRVLASLKADAKPPEQ